MERPVTHWISVVACFTSGLVAAMLLAGCGLNTAPQRAPAVPSQSSSLPAAPASVRDRMTHAAPDLYFDVNSHYLRARERHKLAQIAPALQDMLHDYPDLVIVIEGHSDDRGLIEYNDQLASERAEAVRRILLELSFPEDRLRTASFGHRAPQCLTHDEECRRKNRRVHFRAAHLATPPTH